MLTSAHTHTQTHSWSNDELQFTLANHVLASRIMKILSTLEYNVIMLNIEQPAGIHTAEDMPPTYTTYIVEQGVPTMLAMILVKNVTDFADSNTVAGSRWQVAHATFLVSVTRTQRCLCLFPDMRQLVVQHWVMWFAGQVLDGRILPCVILYLAGTSATT